MALDGLFENQREIGDNIGEQDSNQQLILKRNVEKLFIESGPLIIESRDVTGDVLIWSNATHGIWDTDKWDNDTTDLTAYSVARVVNPNNIWREHFRNNQFKDNTNTTATWNISTFKIVFTSGQVAQTLDIFKNSVSIKKVKVMSTEGSGSDLDYYMSINGGDSFFQVNNNEETLVANNEVTTIIDLVNYPSGRRGVNIVVAGTPSGSVFTNYDNKGLMRAGVIHPYLIDGVVYDTDGSTPLADVYLVVQNETTGARACTVKATGSTGRWIFDCRSLGQWNNGDLLRISVVGGTGTDDKELRFKAISRGTSSITNLKVQYWT